MAAVHTHIHKHKKTGIIKAHASCCGYDGVMIFHEHSHRVDYKHGTHRNKHTHRHTTHNPQAHTAPPKLKRGDEPALQDNPAAHMRFTHMLGGLVNIPLMGEKTQDTGRGEK